MNFPSRPSRSKIKFLSDVRKRKKKKKKKANAYLIGDIYEALGGRGRILILFPEYVIPSSSSDEPRRAAKSLALGSYRRLVRFGDLISGTRPIGIMPS